MAMQVSRFIAKARAQYFMSQERKDPQARTKLRVFNVGDEVTIHRPTEAENYIYLNWNLATASRGKPYNTM